MKLNISQNNLILLILYKSLVLLILFMGVMISGIYGVNKLFGIVYWLHIINSVLIILFGKKNKKITYCLIIIMSLLNIIVCYPFVGIDFPYNSFGKNIRNIIYLSPFLSFLLYYDLKISLPKYK